MNTKELEEQETFEPFVRDPVLEEEHNETVKRLAQIKARLAERARHDDLWNDLYFLLFQEAVERA